VEVIGEDGIGTVYYDTPYLRDLPIRYERKITRGDEYSVEEIRPTYMDPYTIELQQLYEHIKNRTEPKTNIEDSIGDLKLFKAIINVAKTGEETGF
jgi:predicted dehydrogenase